MHPRRASPCAMTCSRGRLEHFVADYNLLRQVLTNLLANAIKFTARGEIVVAVRGTVERVTIEVRDTGCGIPLEQRHKLFMHGERLGAERTAIPGNGIGLATSRRLVHCMGGDIGYRENLGGGSIFWVSLPTGMLEEKERSRRHPRMMDARHASCAAGGRCRDESRGRALLSGETGTCGDRGAVRRRRRAARRRRGLQRGADGRTDAGNGRSGGDEAEFA